MPLKQRFLRAAYQTLAKPIFFLQDPERVHDRMTLLGERLGKHQLGRWLIRTLYNAEHPHMRVTTREGLHLRTPVGLAAGFDKNARLLSILPELGFGAIEVGSITAQPCPGNPRPRLWRLKKSKSIQVYYGLMNEGIDALIPRLKAYTGKSILGISIAVTNTAGMDDPEAAANDYAYSYQRIIEEDIGEYITINVSCPNTQCRIPFNNPRMLPYLFDRLFTHGKEKPVYLKISADYDKKELDILFDTVRRYPIDGLIFTNLAKNLEDPLVKERLKDPLLGKGGLSGKVVEPLAKRALAYAYHTFKGEKTLVSVGGIFTPDDALERFQLGADWLQLITGMIYEGPQLMSDITLTLGRKLEKEGKTLNDIRGENAEDYLKRIGWL